ncbi:DUF2332 family protein [Arthrobacter sp. H-02-3]|uniref:DUF2332 family protein n=1 Tax=Arthrobacter sp. H-02-3 TaxID=2703675 RepID=UPI001F38309D|nr:DUF2332 family protein [Arthrobacter sp. H-02-3]
MFGHPPPVLRCVASGPVPLPAPAELPRVVWRACIDLNPVDVRSPDDVPWLEAFGRPEQEFHFERLLPGDRDRPGAAPRVLVAGNRKEQRVA